MALLSCFQTFKKTLAPRNFVELVPDFYKHVAEFSIYLITAFL